MYGLIGLAMLALLAVETPALAAHPFWCEDLGLKCNGSAEAFSRYAGLDPNEFLPPELAAFVQRCQIARASGDPNALKEAKLANPLRADPKQPAAVELRLIAKPELKKADLPASGARMVADCTGRHIQAKDSLTPAQLKNVFQNAYLLQLMTGFSKLHGNAYDEATCAGTEPHVKVYAYSGNVGGKGVKPSSFMADYWEFYPGGAQKGQLTEISHEYVDPACFAMKPGAAKQLAAKTEKAQLTSFVDGVNLLEVMLLECEQSCGEGNVMAGYEPPAGPNHDACVSCINRYWSARRDFDSRLTRTDYAAYMDSLSNSAPTADQEIYYSSLSMKVSKKITSEPKVRQMLNWCMDHACECSFRIEGNLNSIFSEDSAGSPELRAQYEKMTSKMAHPGRTVEQNPYTCTDQHLDDNKWPDTKLFESGGKGGPTYSVSASARSSR